jgi:hypothetical protein
MVCLVIVIFEFNTCYSISYSLNNICNDGISLLFYLMKYLVMNTNIINRVLNRRE